VKKFLKFCIHIPKNSIRIPIAGGTYSPDFAYIVEFESGKKTLNLLIERRIRLVIRYLKKNSVRLNMLSFYLKM
jgi:hypothetical protein